jgi:hypothetical protein
VDTETQRTGVGPPRPPADRAVQNTVLARKTLSVHRIAWTPNALIDRDRRFAVIFSEKSACTTAVIWFCNTLGLADEARAYSEWPHDYRIEVLQHPAARFRPNVEQLDDFTVLQVIRDPFERAASSFRHAIGLRYADQTIRTKIGVDIPKDGLSFQQFLDFLKKEDLRACDPHHRMQSCSLMPGRLADVVINISHQDLFQELNAFELRMRMPPTDFANLAWIHQLQATRTPKLIDMGPDPDQLVLTVNQALRGPWPSGLLTERSRSRIEILYADDISRYGQSTPRSTQHAR